MYHNVFPIILSVVAISIAGSKQTKAQDVNTEQAAEGYTCLYGVK